MRKLSGVAIVSGPLINPSAAAVTVTDSVPPSEFAMPAAF
jgi:hypothetical protein